MDPQVRSFLALVNNANQPSIQDTPIEKVREQFNQLAPIFHPHVDVDRIENCKTDSGISLRMYYPWQPVGQPIPAIVYFHGGGWVMGNIETHDTLCRHLANASGAVVISVDYRLAPDFPYPAAFDDAFEASCFVQDHSEELKINPGQIGLAGDSAGGNLALAVALKSRKERSSVFAGQCLLYPVLDSRCGSESYVHFAEDHGLTKAKMEFFWNAYLGESDPTDPLISPSFADDFSNLPPTMIVTAEYDVLRDEGEKLGAQLKKSGVRVEIKRCEGVIHGFIHFAGAIERGQEELISVGKQFGDWLRTGR
jgi:acetyl esterase